MAKRTTKSAKPKIKAGDIHLVLHARARVLKCFDSEGKLRWSCLARGEGVSGPGWTMESGDTPPGLYSCDQVIETRRNEPEYAQLMEVYGPWFISLNDEETRDRGGATGIGIHGGRDRSPGYRPARATDLAKTRGCVRVDNTDLVERVVPAVRFTQKQGGTAWLSVVWE